MKLFSYSTTGFRRLIYSTKDIAIRRLMPTVFSAYSGREAVAEGLDEILYAAFSFALEGVAAEN